MEVCGEEDTVISGVLNYSHIRTYTQTHKHTYTQTHRYTNTQTDREVKTEGSNILSNYIFYF